MPNIYKIIEKRVDDLHETYYPPSTLSQTFTTLKDAETYVEERQKQQPDGPIYSYFEIKQQNR